MQAQQEGIADWVQYTETIDSKDYAQNIGSFAKAGYDIIVADGSTLSEATFNAANNYPNIFFIGIGQQHDNVVPNLVNLDFHEDHSGFLAGALAAQLTRSNTIAAIFGADTEPDVAALQQGYEAGAKSINPAIHIISFYHPGTQELASNDPLWGANAAAEAIQNGADVVIGTSGNTGHGALIKTASYPGLYCIGADADLWETVSNAHPCLVSSVVKQIGLGVLDIIKLTKNGNFPAGIYYGSVGFAPYHDFESVIPQAVKDKIGLISSGLNAGSITTGYNPGK